MVRSQVSRCNKHLFCCRENVEIVYFEGNHDLHLRYFWGDRLGLTVSAGPRYFELCGRTLRIEHGDQMDPDDTAGLMGLVGWTTIAE